MQKRLSIPLIAGLAMLSACATPTPYQPANNSGFGYTEQQLEGDRWQLTFSGNSSTDRSIVEQYLLFRAAEITDQQGFDVFRVVQREVDTESRFTTTGNGFGGGFNRHGFGGVGGFATFSTNERRNFEAIAEIKLESGEPGEEDDTAYVADEVLQTLSGAIVRPS
ncbi:MAG: hypothetical protein AAFR41_10025 [Pseudomonadota bacterium]